MYQALYRKYRPQVFDDVVGQESVTETLKNQLRSGKLSHAYLFTGTRGTGKTSCAKLLARAVNCENLQDGNPCNRCPSCRSILSGGCMDVLEIDAASNNFVDSVRALRDDAIYTPAEVRMRVYIIDEVHMLSTAAFNALLKIIEEPPAHLLFILATTELHKVPATILSRCQRFAFRRLRPADIEGRLNRVAYEEGIDAEPEALRLLARLADGALRDGLSLLDQCAAGGGRLTAETVYGCLGLAGDRKTAALMEAVADRDAGRALALFDGLYQGGKDAAAVLDELCSLSRDLLLCKTAPDSAPSMLSGVCTDEELRALLGRFSAGELLRNTALLQRAAAGAGGERRLGAELCLVSLCAPQLQLDAASLNARLSRLEEAAASGRLAVPAPAGTEDEERPPFPGDEAAPAAPEAPEEAAPQPPPADAALPVGFWTDLLAGLGALPASVRGFLPQARPALRGDTLLVEAENAFVQKMLDTPSVLQPLAQRAAALLGRPVRPKVTVRGRAGGDGRDHMEALLDFGRQHPDIIEIK